MALLQFVVGALLLTLGRRLFWLFVAGAGFLAGLQFAPRLLPGQPANVILIAALVVAVAGAVLAVLLQRLAVGLAGFIVGGYAAVYLAEALGLLGSSTPINPPGLPTAALASLNAAITGGPPVWLIFLIGGVIGALLVAAVFDLALVLLSSLAGAALVAQAVTLPAGVELAVFLVLVALGIIIQTRLFRGRR